ERSLGRDYYGAVGFVYVRGSDLPTTTYINLINPVGTLADGRPIYSSAVNAGTRLDPRFNRITEVQSIGDSRYKALQVQFGRRLTAGLQFDFTYTFGKCTDTAPLISTLSVQGDDPRSDPSNLQRDKGPNLMDVRHSFVGTIIASPTVHANSQILNA